MWRTIKEMFESALQPTALGAVDGGEHALRLATAVLLVEVMRSDASIDAVERQHILHALNDKFGLPPDEAARLVDLAEHTASRASDLFGFTSTLNERLEMPQKLRMVEHLWRVAFADGTLDAHENHLMRRISDLLYIPHGAYVAAKARARDAVSAGRAAGS